MRIQCHRVHGSMEGYVNIRAAVLFALAVICLHHTQGASICHCQNQSQCDTYPEQGCSQCEPGWSGRICQTQNVAYRRTTIQSTTYINCPPNNCDIRSSNNAVDGSTETDSPDRCAETRNETTDHYWGVRLARSTDISQIRVFFSQSGGSLRGLQVLIDGTLCYTATTQSVPRDLWCGRTLQGYNITLFLPAAGYRSLAVCELQVFSCGDEWYGFQCDKRCTCRDSDEVCDKTTGACSSGCPPGYAGVDCKVCADGRYGEGCSSVCGSCLADSVCDKRTGTCYFGCESGWSGAKCNTPCADGRYGNQCALSCGSCLIGHCNKSTGVCPSGCAAGYRGSLCVEVCVPGTYGANCASSCGRCRYGQVCDRETGRCEQGCAAGWRTDSCNVECETYSYGVDCKENCGLCKNGLACNKATGDCTDGCQPGWIGSTCKSECPVGKYGEQCASSCGLCKDYKPCDKVDGLCMQGCLPGFKPNKCTEECDDGFYGFACQFPCGDCKDSLPCNKVTGSCPSGCQPGKSGDLCDADCLDGKYGESCGYTCGQCREPGVCDKVTGACPFGCQTGYNGSLCQTACNRGSYGFQCLKKCGQCLDLTQCDFATGQCPSGCQPGWKDATCNQVCTSSTYGRNCADQCGYCKGGVPCDRMTGHCEAGCDPGYRWEQCKEECAPGTYGLNCNGTCGKCGNGTICDHVTGRCPGACEPGWLGEDCRTACSDGTYGTTCTENCGHCAEKVACDKVDGTCPGSKCEPGWTSDRCDQLCPDGLYGSECTSTCGSCEGDAACSRFTGECPGGCQVGWTGDKCAQECPDGRYGADCAAKCGNCVSMDSCDKATGNCINGCAAGFSGLQCDKKCPTGVFGMGCALLCGQCGSPCDHVTGTCSSCLAGWRGSKCTQQCGYGTYGPNCESECGACRDGTTCNSKTGLCPTGCKPGSSGDRCDQGCPSGQYGDECSLKCGECLDGADCDTNTGRCPAGCRPSYIGEKCDENCPDGYYGTECELVCGNCLGGTPCSKLTGACPLQQCDQGFVGDLCQEELPPQEDDTTPMIAGIIAAVVVMAIVVLVVVICLVKRRKQKDNFKSKADDVVLDPIDNEVVSVGADNVYTTLSGMSTTRSSKRSESVSNPFDIESSLGLSIPTRVSSVITASDLSGQVVSTDEDDMDIRSVDSEYQWPGEDDTSTAFSVYEIGEHIEMKMDAGGFENEFSMLPKGLRFPHFTGLHPSNEAKNRYPKILPYDESRVYLTNADPKLSDYINASHIDGFRILEEYIAAQGPLLQTVNDFWNMVWHKKVCKIVMLGRTRENSKNKCYKYWPDAKEGHTYGDLSVTCSKVQARAHYTVREFYMYDHQGAEKRLVTQYQFITWPDSGLPSPPVLASFIKHVNKKDTSRFPTVVHCSSGIGRTGCYIAINGASEQARLEPEIDVFKFVCNMRLRRPEMVPTRVQYAGVHQTLHDMVASRDTLLSVSQLMEKYRGTAFRTISSSSALGAEYQTLDEMRPRLSQQEIQAALRPENMKRNRNLDILPGSRHRVILKGTAVKLGHYINAVFLPSVLHRRGFILTQHPLTNTLEQFWTMVQEQESVTIVSLNPQEVNPLDRKEFVEYMPKANGQTLSVGKYEILLKSTNTTREEIPEKTIILKTKGAGDFTPSRHIKVFSVPDWTAGEVTPSNKHVLLLLLDALVRRQKDAGQHPIIVHCLDGASRSGLFCVISNIISRLKLDKEVDIFLTVRELQHIRPAIIPNFSQYSFCYEVARNYVKNNEAPS